MTNNNHIQRLSQRIMLTVISKEGITASVKYWLYCDISKNIETTYRYQNKIVKDQLTIDTLLKGF